MFLIRFSKQKSFSVPKLWGTAQTSCALVSIQGPNDHLLEMIRADDTTEVIALFWIFTVPFFNYFFSIFNEFWLNFRAAQNVIWRDARLSDVYEFSPKNSLRCDSNISRTVDVHWAEKHCYYCSEKLSYPQDNRPEICHLFSSFDFYLFPPNSKVTGVKYLFAASRTILPTVVDPV